MTDLTISGNRAKTVGKAGGLFSMARRQMEGNRSLNKDGTYSFEPTQHNLSVWLNFFPDATIDDRRESEKLFGAVTQDVERPAFTLLRQPMPHQQKAFDKLKGNDVFGLFYDPGAGKSKSLTDIATYHWCQGDIDAMIIWTPNALVSEQWTRRNDPDGEGQLERDIHSSIPWDCWLWGKTKSALKDFEKLKSFNGFKIIVMNIDAGKTPAGEKIMLDFIKRHNGRVLFAIDESHLIKTKTSARAKAAFRFGGMVNMRAILTGTPIGKDLLDLWSQFIFLDEKIIGVRYKTAFMNAYCVTRWNGFAQVVVGHKNVDKLYEKIEPYTYRISQAELGLESLYDEFEFELYPEQKTHYKQLKEQFVTLLDDGEFLTAANAVAAMVRMQQCSNGYLVREDGSFQLLPNARLDAMSAWLETISDDKIVIWCRYKQDARIILEKLGRQAVDLSGNVDKKIRSDNKDRFINKSEIRYTVGTPDAAGTGTDGLQAVCNRALRYSLSYNLILHEQSEKRTSRIGGSGTAFYTDLIGKGTLDRRILKNLTGKKDLSKMTIDDIRRMVEE